MISLCLLYGDRTKFEKIYLCKETDLAETKSFCLSLNALSSFILLWYGLEGKQWSSRLPVRSKNRSKARAGK